MYTWLLGGGGSRFCSVLPLLFIMSEVNSCAAGGGLLGGGVGGMGGGGSKGTHSFAF